MNPLMSADPNQLIPKKALIRWAEEWLEGIVKRPLMYGGDWNGVEVAILDALAAREFALAWPHDPPGHLGLRWCVVISKVHRATNTTLANTLKYDGITEHDAVRDKYEEALREFFKNDGLFPRILAHHACGGCKKHGGHGPEHVPHCSSDCPTWPCDHTDGQVEAARWAEWYAHVKENLG